MNATLVEANNLQFNVIDEGRGSPVLMLHGFPDTSTVWRKQLPVLVANEYRVIAPDLRGRGESDMPERVEDYAIPFLIQDVTGIMDQLGVETATLVGHDWGAALAWSVAAFAPERVERLIAISVGHPVAFSRRTIDQLARSWYMWIFQFEGVAEELFTKDDWRLFRDWVGTRPDYYECIDALSKPGRFTAGINWYRANIRPESLVYPPPQFPPINCPVLGVWSDRDFALSEKQMVDSREFVTGPWTYEKITGVGHWIPLEASEKLNTTLIDFLAREFE